MSISTVRSLTTDLRCFPVHREIFFQCQEKSASSHSRAYSLSSRERNPNEQTVRNTRYQPWNCRTVEGSSGKTGTSSSGVEKLSNKLFALFRFFLPFHSLRSLSFVPLCRGRAGPMLERLVHYRSLLSACLMARGNRLSSPKLKGTVLN